jgi:hypothetical protein
MRITVIATGFDKEIVSVASASRTNVMPRSPPRYVPRPPDDLPRPNLGARADDLDVPTFIRRKRTEKYLKIADCRLDPGYPICNLFSRFTHDQRCVKVPSKHPLNPKTQI